MKTEDVGRDRPAASADIPVEKNRRLMGPLTARRSFLSVALACGGAVAVGGEFPLGAQTPAQAAEGPQPAPIPSPATQEFAQPTEDEGLTVDHPQSDVMVDVLKSLNLDYIAANPGSSFRGLHESIINYGGNKSPELITCLHEETSVAIAAGYARVTGRPMAVMMHSVVGLQHGAMSIYHAFADRVPVLMFVGASLDANTRRPFIEWEHSAQDQAAMVRDFTKWDDQPTSIQHFAESTVRAVKLATTAPMGPTLISIDMDLQEEAFKPTSSFAIPALSPTRQPVADAATVTTIAQALLTAQSPIILAHRYARTHEGMSRLVQLAELLQVPVVDSGDRFNFPTDHPLNQSQRLRALIPQADVILALEPVDLWGALNKQKDLIGHPTQHIAKPDATVITIGTSDTAVRSNFQDFQRYVGVGLAVSADAESTLPLLIEELKKHITADLDERFRLRRKELDKVFLATREHNLQEAKIGWDATPITTGRLFTDLWDVIKDEDWVLASHTVFASSWPQRIWNINKPHQMVGGIGAGGIGSNIGVCSGVALAHRGSGKIVINIQGDGDLLYAPGALWTAAHHKIPILHIVHNNRAYHQEVMHVQRMANRRQRGIDRAHIGTTIADPNINFAKLAEAMGVWSEGPISAPDSLKAALRRAVKVVKNGEPALIEVVSQPR